MSKCKHTDRHEDIDIIVNGLFFTAFRFQYDAVEIWRSVFGGWRLVTKLRTLFAGHADAFTYVPWRVGGGSRSDDR